jgi:hypothetical protein
VDVGNKALVVIYTQELSTVDDTGELLGVKTSTHRKL